MLQGLCLKVQKGEHVAVVGPSGSGKSTLAALLCAVYSPVAGRVLIDDCDVGALDASHLRGQLVCVVPQVVTHSCTVRAAWSVERAKSPSPHLCHHRYHHHPTPCPYWQEAVLLSGTLRENIALGRPSATDDELISAARRAGCDFAEDDWEREVGSMGCRPPVHAKPSHATPVRATLH